MFVLHPSFVERCFLFIAYNAQEEGYPDDNPLNNKRLLCEDTVVLTFE